MRLLEMMDLVRLAPEPEDIEALNADPYPEWDPNGDPLVSTEATGVPSARTSRMWPKRLRLNICWTAPPGCSRSAPEDRPYLRAELIELIKCVIKCVLEQKSNAEEVSTVVTLLPHCCEWRGIRGFERRWRMSFCGTCG